MQLDAEIKSLCVNISKPGGLTKGDNPFEIDGTLDGKQIIAMRGLTILETTEIVEGNSLFDPAVIASLLVNLVTKNGDVLMNSQPYNSMCRTFNGGQLFTFNAKIDTRQSFLYADKPLLNTYARIEFFYI